MMPLKGQMQPRSSTIKGKTTDTNPGQTDKNSAGRERERERSALPSPLGALVLIKLKLIGTATAALCSENLANRQVHQDALNPKSLQEGARPVSSLMANK